MKAKFTEQSVSYVGKAAVIAHFVARIKSASGGKNNRHQECQRYQCQKCARRFDDVTGTIFQVVINRLRCG
ncbi:MAG: hypothetical protein QX189_09125 [Methylococcales bacterium]